MAFSVGKVTTATELAWKAHEKDKEKMLEEMVPPYLHDLLPVFDKQTASHLPEHMEYNHEINLKPGFNSMKAQVYLITPLQRTELEKFIQENESKGYIQPSKLPIASPFFFVGKKDGTYRPCQDYCTLNANTIKDHYPLPLITDLMEKMRGHSTSRGWIFAPVTIMYASRKVTSGRLCSSSLVPITTLLVSSSPRLCSSASSTRPANDEHHLH